MSSVVKLWKLSHHRTLLKCLFIYIFIIDCNCDIWESPCPKMFHYAMDQRNNLYGELILYNPDENRIQLDVQLSIANTLQQGANGRIDLVSPKEIVVADILKRRPVRYLLNFPYWEHYPPKVTKIWINGELVCSGQGYDVKSVGVVTTVNLEHTLKTNINQLRSAKFYQPIPDNIYGFKPAMPKSTTPDSSELHLIDFNPQVPKDPSRIYPTNPFLANQQRQNFIDTSPLYENFFKTEPTQNTLKLANSSKKPQTTTYKPPNFDAAAFNFQARRPNFNRFPAVDSQTFEVANTNQNAYTCGVAFTGNQLIAHGASVSRNRYPWLVALYRIVNNYYDNFTCAGTLISNKHVLTAAHCLKPNGEIALKPNEVIVALGRHNINSRNEGITIEPDAIYVHDDYRVSSKDADIAVIVLKIDAPVSETIQPICLWNEVDGLDFIVGQNGLVVGWGRDETGAYLTADPREIIMPIVSRETCHKSNVFFQKVATTRTFCAGNRDGSGPCNGDSGGGFMMLRNRRWTLRGIVSLSILNPLSTDMRCDLNEYIVFTDVTKFSSWLYSVMRK